MKKIYAITVAAFIVIVVSLLFQFLKEYFASFEATGAVVFVFETIKIIPLILGVLLIKYSWNKITTNS